jgi:hypothetical protein
MVWGLTTIIVSSVEKKTIQIGKVQIKKKRDKTKKIKSEIND